MTEPTGGARINDREPYESTWAQGRYQADGGSAPDWDPDDDDAPARRAAIERARQASQDSPSPGEEITGEG